MDLELTGTTALVTGRSKGIGYAIAKHLAAEGANIAICARTEGPSDFYDAIDAEVRALLDDAERRAQENSRKTVQLHDL